MELFYLPISMLTRRETARTACQIAAELLAKPLPEGMKFLGIEEDAESTEEMPLWVLKFEAKSIEDVRLWTRPYIIISHNMLYDAD